MGRARDLRVGGFGEIPARDEGSRLLSSAASGRLWTSPIWKWAFRNRSKCPTSERARTLTDAATGQSRGGRWAACTHLDTCHGHMRRVPWRLGAVCGPGGGRAGTGVGLRGRGRRRGADGGSVWKEGSSAWTGVDGTSQAGGAEGWHGAWHWEEPCVWIRSGKEAAKPFVDSCTGW